jgi:type I restriction enzyme S subunit
MAGEWQTAPLSELTVPDTPVTYGVVKPGPEDPNGVLFIRGGDIADGRVITERLRTITREVSQQYRRTQLRGGEIVVSLVGNPGQVAVVPATLKGANIARQAGLIRLREDVNTRFVKYFLSSRTGQEALGAHSLGSVQQVINLRDLKKVRVPIPPLPEQRAIAHILGTLDDKIELSRRMSETLEAMARALFQSWFVDFGPVRARAEGRDPGLPKPLADLFPARLVDSELGEIPEGWEVRSLGDIADLDKGLSYKGEGLVREGGLPLINLGCFAGGGRFKTDSVKRYSGPYRHRHVVRAGDLVIANTDMTQNRVVLGSPALLPALANEREYLFSHHTFAVRFKSGAGQWKSFVYFSLLRPEFREIAEGYATGTTVLALPRDGVLRYQLVLPADELRAVFERHIGALLSKAEKAGRQNDTLGRLRDALLPKLVSGDLRVKDAEKFIARAV